MKLANCKTAFNPWWLTLLTVLRRWSRCKSYSLLLCGLFYEAISCVILFLYFSVLLALRLPRLGKRELILVLFYVCLICAGFDLSVSSSSWCLGTAAVCDCGTPWTFLLSLF